MTLDTGSTELSSVEPTTQTTHKTGIFWSQQRCSSRSRSAQEKNLRSKGSLYCYRKKGEFRRYFPWLNLRKPWASLKLKNITYIPCLVCTEHPRGWEWHFCRRCRELLILSARSNGLFRVRKRWGAFRSSAQLWNLLSRSIPRNISKEERAWVP